MRYRLLFRACAAAALSLSVSAPASAETAWNGANTKSSALKWELSYLARSAIDAGQTMECLHRDICQEGNPLFGKHPSAGTLILAKVGFGLAHFLVFSRLNDHNPKAALRLAQVSCAVQGSIVALNARFTFK
jgi:hypothetical protein